ncbi:uncharacterized protein LOC119795192 [Cyprinodon tularosa]|uniref:uncharacterized protein LOC119795192 n=1 Tax=Cyprinodon tularosa TaxID=77115 RepID=UPI0018E23BDA|nr:uncharacterized protein LOC119795192 [Cyprinodon tularosa]
MASKERGATWDDAETEAVIAIWAEDAIQAMLEGAKHNHKVFKKISDEITWKMMQHEEHEYSTHDEMDDERSLNESIASCVSEEPGGSRIPEGPGDDTPAAKAPESSVKRKRKSKTVKAIDSTIEEYIKAQKQSDDLWLAAFKEHEESIQRHQRHMMQEMERNRFQAEEKQREHEMRMMQMMVQLLTQPAQLQPLNPASPSTSVPNFSTYGPYQ